MANLKHVQMLAKGRAIWNRWRVTNKVLAPELSQVQLFKASLSGFDLSGADLSGACLREAHCWRTNFKEANLFEADLSGAKLWKSDFSEANLCKADLRNADFSESNLREADLSRTNLKGSWLGKANLHEAFLRGADFTEVGLLDTQLGKVDLGFVHGLDAVNHRGPSTVGIDTLFLSQGRIPEIFLRGCGVPQEFIAYMHSLLINPVEFNSCFISYSHKDEDFARHLYSELRDKSLRVWYAPEEMKGGEKLHQQIEQAIQMHDRLLLVLSEHSMSSEWVKTEIYNARQREIKENRRILFPIALAPFDEIKEWKFFDADTGKDLSREIREYYIPNFSQWKDHDAFQVEFAKLLRDLKAAAPKAKAP